MVIGPVGKTLNFDQKFDTIACLGKGIWLRGAQTLGIETFDSIVIVGSKSLYYNADVFASEITDLEIWQNPIYTGGVAQPLLNVDLALGSSFILSQFLVGTTVTNPGTQLPIVGKVNRDSGPLNLPTPMFLEPGESYLFRTISGAPNNLFNFGGTFSEDIPRC